MCANTLDEALEVINGSEYGDGIAQSGATTRKFGEGAQVRINVSIPVSVLGWWCKVNALEDIPFYGRGGTDFYAQIKIGILPSGFEDEVTKDLLYL